jgi:hypothetical protein
MLYRLACLFLCSTLEFWIEPVAMERVTQQPANTEINLIFSIACHFPDKKLNSPLASSRTSAYKAPTARALRLSVRTSDFHSEKRGSTPLGRATVSSQINLFASDILSLCRKYACYSAEKCRCTDKQCRCAGLVEKFQFLGRKSKIPLAAAITSD